MRRRHAMPFGAEVLPEGGVRFRLWAPTAGRVDLVLEGGPGAGRTLPMARGAQGWHEGLLGEAAPGTLYRYRIDGGLLVPDPASRRQPQDVHGPSEVVDPSGHEWEDAGWTGRPWEETALYELHVGSFTPEGTFAAAAGRLKYLAGLGVTAVEMMPIADFPGRRNWGYDGVLPFAPDSAYGRPEDLKRFVETAHGLGLMVFLDVVYNHFGPEGNYLHVYAEPFFTRRHHTPWGAAINFDGEGSAQVREFVRHNALYWLEEFHMDGLRLDSVHAIHDDSRPHILDELAESVRGGPGHGRHVHLVLENDDNAARYLARSPDGKARLYDAQWNDDLHHALHVCLTGEQEGYYMDYADTPARHLARCLAEGFAYQGEASAFRDGALRGTPSRDLPPTAFVPFLQNHDQVGNRALGERISELAGEARVRAATVVLLLAPSPPLLFMGQEWGCRQPFPFFCDFGPELAQAVTEGRRREFGKFASFRDPKARLRIPDPNAEATFQSAVLDWDAAQAPEHQAWLEFHQNLLNLRQREITPRLSGLPGAPAAYQTFGERGFLVRWRLAGGFELTLLANLGPGPAPAPPPPAGRLLAQAGFAEDPRGQGGALPPWSAAWFLSGPSPQGENAP